MDDGHPFALLSEMEDDTSLEWLLSDRGLSTGNVLVGVGGAILVHLLAMLLTLISPLMWGRTAPLGNCVTVSLVEPTAIGNPGGAKQGFGEPPAEARSGAREEGPSSRCDLLDLAPERDPDSTPQPEAIYPDPANAEPEPVRNLDTPHVSQQAAKGAHLDQATRKPVVPPKAKNLPRRAMKGTSTRSQRSTAESRSSSSNGSSEVAPKSEHDAGGGTSDVPGGIGNEGKAAGAGTLTSGIPSGEPAFPAELNVNQVDISPELVEKVEPTYPFMARRNGVSGKVRVKLLVGIDGHVIRPSIVEAEPKGVFDQTVLEAIQKWKFKPGIYRGRRVATWVILPVQFRLAR